MSMVIKSSAVISQCGLYRYELRREWSSRRPPFCALLLNPSKADARRNDPTIIRLMRRANSLGFGSLIVINLGAGRATDPKQWLAMADPIGPDNFDHIKTALVEAANRNGMVLVGWGRHARQSEVQRIILLARRCGIILYCMGKTLSGQPIHPLYVSYGKKPIPWE